MAGEFDFLKDLGFSPEDFRGKSGYEAAALIEKRAKEKKSGLLEESRKELFENAVSKFPAFREKFNDMFQVFVKPLGMSKKPNAVTVAGFLPMTGEIIILNGTRLSRIPESNLIKSEQEYENAKPKEKNGETEKD